MIAANGLTCLLSHMAGDKYQIDNNSKCGGHFKSIPFFSKPPSSSSKQRLGTNSIDMGTKLIVPFNNSVHDWII